MFLKIAFLCLMSYTTAAIKTGFGVKWKDFDNVFVSTNVISEVPNVHRGLLCVLLCFQNMACISVFYRRLHRRCQLHDVLFTSPNQGEQDTGTVYYSLNTGACPAHNVHNRPLNLCYQLHTDRMTHSGAVAVCASRGEHLLVIDSENKQNHVVKQITCLPASVVCNYFVDGSDADIEGQWIFSDGRPMTYFAWGPGNPKNVPDDRDNLLVSKSGKTFLWEDTKPKQKRCFICEKDLWIP